jgi:hypothetical protein
MNVLAGEIYLLPPSVRRSLLAKAEGGEGCGVGGGGWINKGTPT